MDLTALEIALALSATTALVFLIITLPRKYTQSFYFFLVMCIVFVLVVAFIIRNQPFILVLPANAP